VYRITINTTFSLSSTHNHEQQQKGKPYLNIPQKPIKRKITKTKHLNNLEQIIIFLEQAAVAYDQQQQQKLQS
jgi:hypothetical protein